MGQGTILNIGGGGGGAGLNFSVINIPDTNSFPLNPKENTIALISNDMVTGWSIDTMQPLVATEGHVWVRISVNGDTRANILKKNEATITIVGILQYQDGYKGKEAYIWQN